MDILSEVLDVLDLKCTAVEPIVLRGGHTVGRASLQAVVVVSGRCTLRIPVDAAEHELRSLDCVLLTGESEQEIWPCPGGPASPARLLRCVYRQNRDGSHPLARHLPEHLLLRSQDLTDEGGLGRTIWRLEGERLNARSGFDFVALRLGDIVLVEMLRRCQLDGPKPLFLAALADPVIHAALRQIHDRIERRWRVAELARSVGLSRAAFAERFQLRVGEPPLRYIRHWRMLKAHRELGRTSAPIKTIAALAGYRSAAGFRRAFRRAFGHRPSALRRPPGAPDRLPGASDP